MTTRNEPGILYHEGPRFSFWDLLFDDMEIDGRRFRSFALDDITVHQNRPSGLDGEEAMRVAGRPGQRDCWITYEIGPLTKLAILFGRPDPRTVLGMTRERSRAGPKSRRSHAPVRFSRPPGSQLLRVGRVIFGRRKAERVFDQIIGDMQDEYFEATACGRKAEARMAWFRGVCAFWLAAGIATLLRLAIGVRKLGRP